MYNEKLVTMGGSNFKTFAVKENFFYLAICTGCVFIFLVVSIVNRKTPCIQLSLPLPRLVIIYRLIGFQHFSRIVFIRKRFCFLV